MAPSPPTKILVEVWVDCPAAKGITQNRFWQKAQRAVHRVSACTSAFALTVTLCIIASPSMMLPLSANVSGLSALSCHMMPGHRPYCRCNPGLLLCQGLPLSSPNVVDFLLQLHAGPTTMSEHSMFATCSPNCKVPSAQRCEHRLISFPEPCSRTV